MATSTNGATGAQRWKEMSKPEVGDWRVKGGLAQMLKGGVIMDVVTPDQAKIAEDAGAVSVMALERVPSDIRRDGGVARMSDPDLISGIIDAVSIPVMAKARIGHFVEAQILESLGVDYCDESEVLTPADNEYHIDKWQFKMPYVCGARNIGEALRRIGEGAAMIRTKGEAGTGVTITGSIGYVGPPVSPEADGAQDGDMIIDSNGDGWVFAGSGWTNVGAIRGPEGQKGDQATVAVGSVTTNDVPVDGNGDSQNASVTVSDGTPADPHSSTMNFVFNVPTGATGAKGDAGENFEVYKQASQPVAKNVGAMWIETT